MKRVFIWLDRHFEEALCGFLLVSIMTMLMAQVTIRFLFGHGLTFSEELCRFCFLFLVYFAASLVASKGAHIRVTAHTRKLPQNIRVALLAIADICWIIFNFTVAYQGWNLIESMAKRTMISGTLLIDLRYIYIVLPIAFLLQNFRIIQRWVKYVFYRVSLFEQAPKEEV